MIIKKQEKDINEKYVESMINDLAAIYSNKSSDEYKCKGDITKSPKYDSIEYMIAQLSSLKRYPENEAKAIKTMFNTLHRPIFGKMVTEYMANANERNIIFATAFTVGYRVLVGELSRIFASTEADDKGIVYKPDKVSRRDNAMQFIKKYNADIDKKLDDMIKRANRDKIPVQEAATLEALGAAANGVVSIIEGVLGFFSNIFKSAASLNPVALISAVLSRSYDKKVEKYEAVAAEYEAAKKAYEEYMKIPASQRKKRIEHKYTKMIEKYNIKMGNLKAQIDHFDLRSQNDANDNHKASTKNNDDKLPQSSSTVDTSSGKKDDDDIDF